MFSLLTFKFQNVLPASLLNSTHFIELFDASILFVIQKTSSIKVNLRSIKRINELRVRVKMLLFSSLSRNGRRHCQELSLVHLLLNLAKILYMFYNIRKKM